ncbi:hypothetical protein HYPSUDRAFT_772347 [Hypholoma sublateritium FD-334 SS-4]|uniref:F-box domain-containing protein n=1 Tax=Hypholoma sublateritium (strain FD-334 SS-4) TaxID=945553 RepID=A0A0D2NW59_HYPSF|nr:hypothetical protein HYPSUDRAFT_772347 [Hypholoma sublateritium FD-334 SS-4]
MMRPNFIDARNNETINVGPRYIPACIHYEQPTELASSTSMLARRCPQVQVHLHLREHSIAPIETIPPELLQHIFTFCLPEKAPHPEYLYHSLDLRGFTPRSAPLLLCQVNRLWRECAIALPNLWSSLDVYVCMGKARPALPLASVWIARSGSLPLSLALYQQNESNDNRDAAGEILDLYKGYIHRWANIQFDLTGPRYCRLLTSEQRSAPMLQKFNMWTSYRIYEEEEKDLFGIFEYVPRLSQLSVSRIPDLTLAAESSIFIPWHQLVSLSLDYVPSIGTALRIFEKCPELRDASLKIDLIFGPLFREPVSHSLCSLTINIGQEQVANFMDNLTLPKLTQLAVYVRGPLDQYGWPQRSFGNFLKRSACHLLHFEMHDTGMRFDEFAACLSNPHLQTLERIIVEDRKDWTWDPFVTDLALDLLTCSSFMDKSALANYNALATGFVPGANEVTRITSATCALPNLEALTFRGNCLWTADGAVADMVESRWRFNRKDVRRLRRVELELLSSHVEDFRRLKEFGSEGLELDLLFR